MKWLTKDEVTQAGLYLGTTIGDNWSHDPPRIYTIDRDDEDKSLLCVSDGTYGSYLFEYGTDDRFALITKPGK